MILLKKLQLTNFKGIQSLNLNFDNHVTNIYGANETGKTSTYDAFLWLLFGKDSTDRADFNIRPLDKENKPNNTVETEVIAELDVNGLDVTLKRVFKPKWVKERGALEAEFKGNESVYFYNDVPLKQADYKAKIDSIIDEKLFKLLTNPLYFNTSLKWQDRRSMLVAMAGEVDDNALMDAISNPEYAEQVEELKKQLNGNKKLAEYKSELSAKKKKIKTELDAIPTRIDEAQRQMPTEIPVYTEVEKEISELRTRIAQIDDVIQDSNKALLSQREQANEAMNRKMELELKLRQLQNDRHTQSQDAKNNLKGKMNDLSNDIRISDNNITQYRRELSQVNNHINTIESTLTKLREDWNKANADTLTIDESQFSCPACKRELPEENIELTRKELTEQFNRNKEAKLTHINNSGVSLKTQKEELVKQSSEIQVKIDTEISTKLKLETQYSELTERLKSISDGTQENTEPTETEIKLQSEIESIVIPQVTAPDNNELKVEQSTFYSRINDLKVKLSVSQIVDGINNRIAELETQQKSLAKELSGYEKQEFIVDKFNKSKIVLIENTINGKFKYVRFKMFDVAISGGESECCETLYNGVPFQDVNTAGKILCGIDIINAFSEHYEVFAPIFLDNRESVTEIPETKSQVVNLIVSSDDKKLRIG